MTKEKKKVNTFNILIGLFLLSVPFWSTTNVINEDDLVKTKISLYSDVDRFRPTMAGYGDYYRLWTNEYRAAFVIDGAGDMAASHGVISMNKLIKKGDSLTIKIHQSRLKDESNRSAEIPIYYLEKNGHLLFDTADYNKTQADLDRRWNYVLFIGGVLSLLGGLNIINNKIGLILAAIALAVILVLRHLGLW